MKYVEGGVVSFEICVKNNFARMSSIDKIMSLDLFFWVLNQGTGQKVTSSLIMRLDR